MSNIPWKERCAARDHKMRCPRRARLKGWCLKHYERQRRRGRTGETRTEREMKATAAKEHRKMAVAIYKERVRRAIERGEMRDDEKYR